MQRSCGNCMWWTKLKSIKGLCELHDYGWAKSDYPACEDWKRIKDNNKPRKRINKNEIDD